MTSEYYPEDPDDALGIDYDALAEQADLGMSLP